MTILETIADRNLFGALPAFRDLETWAAWRADAIRAAIQRGQGLPGSLSRSSGRDVRSRDDRGGTERDTFVEDRALSTPLAPTREAGFASEILRQVVSTRKTRVHQERFALAPRATDDDASQPVRTGAANGGLLEAVAEHRVSAARSNLDAEQAQLNGRGIRRRSSFRRSQP
jgi:hypothetical protein